MLVIRNAQMNAFSAYMMLSFEDRMVKVFSSQAADVQDLRALIKEGILRAGGYEITAEHDVAAFIQWMVKFGSDFDTREQFAWVRPILSHQTLPGSVKIQMISRRLDAAPPATSNE